MLRDQVLVSNIITMSTFQKKLSFMKIGESLLIILSLVIVVCGCIFGFSSLAHGQENESNNTCREAQEMGEPKLPFVLKGSLDTTPENPDVDFFKFTGTPGSVMRVDLEGKSTGKGTLEAPFLGLFDSEDCTIIRLNDYDITTGNPRLIFTIPDNGTFVLAVTHCCDDEFVGGGNGTYELTLATQPIAGSITGRIISATTQEPLAGNDYPFTSVVLLRCTNEECYEGVNYAPTDSEGRFQFSTDFDGNPLITGTYQVNVYAVDHQNGQTKIFELGEKENRDIGDFPLEPLPIQFSDIQPCKDINSKGGKCKYSVKLNNTLPERVKGATWSIVYSGGTGSPMDFTNFQTQKPKKIILKPGGSRFVSFSFDVPGTVKDGAFICADVYVSQNPSPRKRSIFFNTIGQSNLFCITKGIDNTFSVISEKDVLRMMNKSGSKKHRTVPGKSKRFQDLISSMSTK